MQEETFFLMPDYFGEFSCKMGACRHACCEGWPITVSMKNYFTLLGIDCSPELRRHLDCALHLTGRPSELEYAQFSPRWDGNCPLRMEDGRCSIHAELGEEPLPDVCRLYPRGIRKREGGGYEISCANSCEGVIELFLHREEPITFAERPFSIALPPLAEPTTRFAAEGLSTALRLRYIEVMQDRRFPIVDRLACLYELLTATEAAFGDREGLERLLTGQRTPPRFKQVSDDAHFAFGIEIAEELVSLLDARSESIRDYGERALANLQRNRQDASNYRRLKERVFETACPAWERLFEHLLVNHMFFCQFPFQDRPVNLREEFTALCVIYSLLRFLCVGLAEELHCDEALVDMLAAAFRLIDHTDFERTAIALLKRIGCTPEGLRDLTAL